MFLLSKLKEEVRSWRHKKNWQRNINLYISQGRIAWSQGYSEYKTDEIKKQLENPTWQQTEVNNYGTGIDERIVEFPWIISKLKNENKKLLDAGSTLNHQYVLDNPLLKNKRITICTYYPEPISFTEKRINYVYEDLREMPFQSQWFDEIVCISTLEHIDMDNTMYGYNISNASNKKEKSYEYLKVVKELYRLLQINGKLLITVPFGKYEQHGFFQQFDTEMINKIYSSLEGKGKFTATYFKYLKTGWQISDLNSCQYEESYNPHTKVGLKNDGAAHSRAICCIEFEKSL